VVRFLGFVDQPAALIAASDVLVLASTKEGFSLVTIEAMALGTPVVATRSGGPEEILVDGETGFLVPAGRAEALADGIVRAMSVPAHTSKIVAQAHDDARRRFSLETMVDAYEARYRRVITGTD
jgi:glycosyltransferase involved in cell wall biosynthesis